MILYAMLSRTREPEGEWRCITLSEDKATIQQEVATWQSITRQIEFALAEVTILEDRNG